MTVRVGVSADPTPVVRAWEEIRAAIRRAGQEGRSFSELDFDHPELKEIADDLRKAQENFEELKKVGRGNTASAVRKGEYEDVIDWHQRHERQFPDAADRRRHKATVGNYVGQGTRWEAPPEGKGGGGGLPNLPMPGLGGMLKVALGLAGINGVVNMLQEGVANAQQEAINVDTFQHTINATTKDFDTLRQETRNIASGLQLAYTETVKLASAFAKESNYRGSAVIADETRTAVGFGRGFGLSEEQSVGMFGKARWMGLRDNSPRELATLFADAIAAGGMWGKAEEVMGAILRWTEGAERTVVEAPNVHGFAAMQAAFNASGKPGLEGEAGAALISQMDSAVRHGGAFGEAGQNFLWRALGENSADKLNPFQFKRLLEGGMFGSRRSAGLGNDSTTNFTKINREFSEMFGNNKDQKWDAMANFFGISASQAKAIDGVGVGGLGGVQSLAKKARIDLRKVDPTAYQELANIAYASDERLKEIKSKYLERPDVAMDRRNDISSAPDERRLRIALAKAAAESGMPETEGTRTRETIADLKNELTRIGERLVEPLNGLRGLVGDILGGLNALVDHIVGPKARMPDFEKNRLSSGAEWRPDLMQWDDLAKGKPTNLNPEDADVLTKYSVGPGAEIPEGPKGTKYWPGDGRRTSDRPINTRPPEPFTLRNEVVLIHKDQAGNPLGEQKLPPTTYLLPVPSGVTP